MSRKGFLPFNHLDQSRIDTTAVLALKTFGTKPYVLEIFGRFENWMQEFNNKICIRKHR